MTTLEEIADTAARAILQRLKVTGVDLGALARTYHHCHGDIPVESWTRIILAAIREAAAPLVDALREFVDYYDQAGIGDCLAGHDDDDDDDHDERFDGDARYNVRHARQALAAFDADSEADVTDRHCRLQPQGDEHEYRPPGTRQSTEASAPVGRRES